MLGHIAELWRFPVKSMQGEPLQTSAVDDTGLLGDRALALRDLQTGQVASAKSPRMWPNLLEFHAAFVKPPRPDQPLPPVKITLPNGDDVTSDDPDVERMLSHATGRAVELISSNPPGATFEHYLPDIDGADPRGADTYTESPNDIFGTGSLHDAAPIHLIATATLKHLSELYPQGQFDVRRFRPNVVVATEETLAGFVENDWVKNELMLGEVCVRLTAPMARCVMITLPQPQLPKDVQILRTVTKHNRPQVLSMGLLPSVGAGGLVKQTGVVRLGDPVVLQPSNPS